MALVTVQRSPTPSATSSPCVSVSDSHLSFFPTPSTASVVLGSFPLFPKVRLSDAIETRMREIYTRNYIVVHMAYQISGERATWAVSQSLRFSAKSTGCLHWHVTDRKCFIIAEMTQSFFLTMYQIYKFDYDNMIGLKTKVLFEPGSKRLPP